jgi:MbtH protein
MPRTPTAPAVTPSDEVTKTTESVVVVNGEGQHSIWWSDRELPAGWTATGDTGTREECLARIGEIWTDMRPASLRARLNGPAAPR